MEIRGQVVEEEILATHSRVRKNYKNILSTKESADLPDFYYDFPTV